MKNDAAEIDDQMFSHLANLFRCPLNAVVRSQESYGHINSARHRWRQVGKSPEILNFALGDKRRLPFVRASGTFSRKSIKIKFKNVSVTRPPSAANGLRNHFHDSAVNLPMGVINRRALDGQSTRAVFSLRSRCASIAGYRACCLEHSFGPHL